MLEENKYKFSNEESFDDVRKIASIQFGKIIKNFNQSSFNTDLRELFCGSNDYYKLFSVLSMEKFQNSKKKICSIFYCFCVFFMDYNEFSA